MMRKQIKNPYGFIYITTNLVNGKRYIGQRGFNSTNGKWQSYLGSGLHLNRAIEKYGRENFKRDIVDIGYTKEELDQKEIQWIKNYKAVESDDFYNIADGGEGGCGKGEKHWNYGKHYSEDLKLKLSKSHKGKKLPEKQKRKISESLKGEKHYMYGKHHSEETKIKMSEAKKGKYIGDKHPNAKAVIQLSLDGFFIAEFSCAVEAEIQTGINRLTISRCCKGKAKTAGNYKWMYKEDYYNQQISTW